MSKYDWADFVDEPERTAADFPRARKHSKYRCSDGMCGAEDCSTCHPCTWQDAEDEDEGEQEGEE